MSTSRSIASNTLISVAARSLGLALAFLSLWFVTRYLGPEQAGKYFTVLAYVGIANVLADLGLYQIFVREISRLRTGEVKIAGAIFSLRLVSLLAVLGVGAPLVATLLPYGRDVKIGIVIGSAAFIFLSLSALLVGIFQKYLHMIAVAVAEFAGRAVQLGLVAALLLSGYGVLAALIAMLAGSTVQFLLMLRRARAYVPFTLSLDTAPWKDVLRASYPVALSTVFSFIYFKVDSLMLSLMRPAYDVGIYGLAYKILEVLVSFPAIFVGIMVPVLARLAVSSREEFRALFAKIFDMLFLSALPLLVGGVLVSGTLMPVFGKGFDDAAPTLNILLFAVFAIFIGTLLANALIVVDRQKALAKIYFVGMAANVLVNFYAIPRWSYIGAAWTTLGTEVFATLFMLLALRKSGFFSVSFERLPRILFATAAMGASIYFFPIRALFPMLATGIVSYTLFAFLFGAVRIGELRELLKGAPGTI